VRVVLDRMLRLPSDSRLAATANETPVWVLTSEAAPAANELALKDRGVRVIRIGARDGVLDLCAALVTLGERGLTRVMLEAGPILSAAFLRADLIDEAVLFRATREIGA